MKKVFTLIIICLSFPLMALAQASGGQIRRPAKQVSKKQSVYRPSQNPIIQQLISNMVYVEGGSFTMGAIKGNDVGEIAHQVTLSSFFIGKYEVTNEEWDAVMNNYVADWQRKRPKGCVSWERCQDFIRILNAIIGKRFRLPTEAEWEYAARGGSRSMGYKYSGSNNQDQVAWYDGNSGNDTHDVGQKSPNELGLYDMSGNVSEWCQDWYGKYNGSIQNDPLGPSSGSYRVIRGGGYSKSSANCNVLIRCNDFPRHGQDNIGLRLAL